jgi:predicted glycosyltransferase
MPVLLRNCLLSVSQGGYNTMMECIEARTRSVIVPFSDGGETEQAMRAKAFAERGAITMVDAAALSPATLARAVDRALTTHPAVPEIDRDGAETTARLIAGLCADVDRPAAAP